MVRPLLYSVLGYDKARRMADRVSSISGREAFDWMGQEIRPKLHLIDLHHVPPTGRAIIIANHPTGLADGIAMWEALKRVRDDVVFLANADAIRISETLDDVIIPVEWVKDKRSIAKAKATFKRVKLCMSQEKCLVIFPSGVPARVVNPNKGEQAWHPGFLTLAKSNNAPVIPARMWAKNSRLYSLASNMSSQLRDITLFHELTNKRNSKFKIQFTPAYSPIAFGADSTLTPERLRNDVLNLSKSE